MKTYNEYLTNLGHALNSVRAKEYAVEEFEKWMLIGKNEVRKTNYTTLLEYVEFQQEKKLSVRTLQAKIKALEYYFDFLEMEKNPAKILKIKGAARQIPHNLLSEEDLETIYELQSTYGLTQKRNKVLLSLVIFQAVGSLEASRIELGDIDLENGRIYIPATRTTNGRTMDLHLKQLLLFQDYITTTRRALLAETERESNLFLVGKGDSGHLMRNIISQQLKKLRWDFPKLQSFQQIRQSRLSLWLKKHDLRKTQYLAGHRYVSSTERYSEDKLEGLKKEIHEFYSLE